MRPTTFWQHMVLYVGVGAAFFALTWIIANALLGGTP